VIAIALVHLYQFVSTLCDNGRTYLKDTSFKPKAIWLVMAPKTKGINMSSHPWIIIECSFVIAIDVLYWCLGE